MTTKDDGGPAFPQYSGKPVPGGGIYYDVAGGMTLRDWFAGQALAGMAPRGDSEFDAEWAYRLADAMMAARKGGAE